MAVPLAARTRRRRVRPADRKSTRLNSSHSQISYAVFCLKKKKKQKKYKSYTPKNLHIIIDIISIRHARSFNNHLTRSTHVGLIQKPSAGKRATSRYDHRH